MKDGVFVIKHHNSVTQAERMVQVVDRFQRIGVKHFVLAKPYGFIIVYDYAKLKEHRRNVRLRHWRNVVVGFFLGGCVAIMFLN